MLIMLYNPLVPLIYMTLCVLVVWGMFHFCDGDLVWMLQLVVLYLQEGEKTVVLHPGDVPDTVITSDPDTPQEYKKPDGERQVMHILAVVIIRYTKAT